RLPLGSGKAGGRAGVPGARPDTKNACTPSRVQARSPLTLPPLPGLSGPALKGLASNYTTGGGVLFAPDPGPDRFLCALRTVFVTVCVQERREPMSGANGSAQVRDRPLPHGRPLTLDLPRSRRPPSD